MSSSPDRPDDRPDERLADLEADLLALGESLDVPAPPPSGVARAVRARLEREAAPGHEAVPGSGPGTEPGRADRNRWGMLRRFRPSPRRVAAGVAVVLAVLLGATPQGRAAVASVLRFAGVEIHVGEPGPLPTGVPRPLPGERRVTLDEARASVRFPVAVPSALPEPADVRVADGGRVVTLFWPGIRLDEYDGTLGVVFRKDLGEPWPEEEPQIRGWWIQQPHGVSYVPSQGVPREERVAGPTLIWQRHSVGLRLEGPDLAGALRIAASVR
ncbi:hypothetical protein [Microbispora sp. ATCC PTA-5024]|uniref:hypothetical protein n=1 Tax=Microbispora sp. ATCC PTA-5024 TaxID=316330 RepID=UPI0003FC5B5E|nr:hypothetical protein [Microbispora sp. ATCC PTA-5024]